MRCILLTSGFALFAVSTLSAQEPKPPAGTTCGESVVAFYDEGPNFAKVMEVYAGHAAYLGGLLKDGKAVAAGRFKDLNRALTILKTADLEQAKTWVNSDPFVKEGIVKATFAVWPHCWAVGLPAPDLAPAKPADKK
jgi:uncharacterized protein YciI